MGGARARLRGALTPTPPASAAGGAAGARPGPSRPGYGIPGIGIGCRREQIFTKAKRRMEMTGAHVPQPGTHDGDLDLPPSGKHPHPGGAAGNAHDPNG